MTTFADIQAFVRSKARLTTTDRDTDIGYSINEAYRSVVGTDLWDFLRTTNTQVLTAGTQDYDLPADFDRMIVTGIRVYTTGTTDYQALEFVTDPDADLWENYPTSGWAPAAVRTIAGASAGARKLRVLPNFTSATLTLAYAYYKRIADVAGTDVLGSPDICDAVAWEALAQDKDWNRDPDKSLSDYQGRAQRALRRARSSLYA